MLCRNPYPDCTSSFPKGLGVEQKCLGPRGRRKYLIRVEAFAKLQIHSPDANLWKVWHASERDGLLTRHYQGLLGSDLEGNNGSCRFRFARDECSATTCDLVRKGFICDKASHSSNKRLRGIAVGVREERESL
jgi:hypothetical protein